MYRSKKKPNGYKSHRQKNLEKSRVRVAHISLEGLDAAQKNRCWICGAFMRKKGNLGHPLRRSKDHLVPVKHGGKGKKANTLFAHRECNSARGCSPLSSKDALKARYYRLRAIAYDLAIC